MRFNQVAGHYVRVKGMERAGTCWQGAHKVETITEKKARNKWAEADVVVWAGIRSFFLPYKPTACTRGGDGNADPDTQTHLAVKVRLMPCW